MIRMLALLVVVVLASTSAFAQTQAPAVGTTEDRPVTTTVWGDTGLWVVPSAEVLPRGRWSFSVARTESDFEQGFTDVSSWPATVAVGAGGGVEFFGALNTVTRIDRDTRPLFFPESDNEPGGLVNEFPTTRQGWSGNKLGDLVVGGKTSVLSEHRQMPMALAFRGVVKIPTSDVEDGVSSGEYDWFADLVAGKEIGRHVDLSGFAGWAWRGDPEGVNLSDGLRWGIGGSFPSRSRFRVNAEAHGEFQNHEDVVADPGVVTAEDGTPNPALSRTDDGTHLSLGVTWQSTPGFFLDAAVVYAFGIDNRSNFGSAFSDVSTDAIGFQFRLGWHGGVKAYVPPPPAVAVYVPPAPAHAPPPPTPPPAPPPTPAPEPPRVEPEEKPVGTAGTQQYVLDDVYFDLDHATLRPAAGAVLDEAVRALKENPERRIDVAGHTCNLGASEYNMDLGQRRAASVRAYLVGHGISVNRISIISFGEDNPAHPNDDAEHRKLNRRVALTLKP